MAGKIITIAQQKGGSGKTTLAAHLAVAGILRKPGTSVAILDTDPQGSLGQWYLKRCETLGEDNAGLELRTASAWGAKLEARNLAKVHDLVIIDTPPKGRLGLQAGHGCRRPGGDPDLAFSYRPLGNCANG